MSRIKKSPGVSLESIREQALKHVALSVKSIRFQRLNEPGNNEHVLNALHNTEEAMFFLAANAVNDDEKKTAEVLDKYGLPDLK